MRTTKKTDSNETNYPLIYFSKTFLVTHGVFFLLLYNFIMQIFNKKKAWNEICICLVPNYV